jgi:hypothetical protein
MEKIILIADILATIDERAVCLRLFGDWQSSTASNQQVRRLV